MGEEVKLFFDAEAHEALGADGRTKVMVMALDELIRDWRTSGSDEEKSFPGFIRDLAFHTVFPEGPEGPAYMVRPINGAEDGSIALLVEPSRSIEVETESGWKAVMPDVPGIKDEDRRAILEAVEEDVVRRFGPRPPRGRMQ